MKGWLEDVEVEAVVSRTADAQSEAEQELSRRLAVRGLRGVEAAQSLVAELSQDAQAAWVQSFGKKPVPVTSTITITPEDLGRSQP